MKINNIKQTITKVILLAILTVFTVGIFLDCSYAIWVKIVEEDGSVIFNADTTEETWFVPEGFYCLNKGFSVAHYLKFNQEETNNVFYNEGGEMASDYKKMILGYILSSSEAQKTKNRAIQYLCGNPGSYATPLYTEAKAFVDNMLAHDDLKIDKGNPTRKIDNGQYYYDLDLKAPELPDYEISQETGYYTETVKLRGSSDESNLLKNIHMVNADEFDPGTLTEQREIDGTDLNFFKFIGRDENGETVTKSALNAPWYMSIDLPDFRPADGKYDENGNLKAQVTVSIGNQLVFDGPNINGSNQLIGTNKSLKGSNYDIILATEYGPNYGHTSGKDENDFCYYVLRRNPISGTNAGGSSYTINYMQLSDKITTSPVDAVTFTVEYTYELAEPETTQVSSLGFGGQYNESDGTFSMLENEHNEYVVVYGLEYSGIDENGVPLEKVAIADADELRLIINGTVKNGGTEEVVRDRFLLPVTEQYYKAKTLNVKLYYSVLEYYAEGRVYTSEHFETDRTQRFMKPTSTRAYTKYELPFDIGSVEPTYFDIQLNKYKAAKVKDLTEGQKESNKLNGATFDLVKGYFDGKNATEARELTYEQITAEGGPELKSDTSVDDLKKVNENTHLWEKIKIEPSDVERGYVVLKVHETPPERYKGIKDFYVVANIKEKTRVENGEVITTGEYLLENPKILYSPDDKDNIVFNQTNTDERTGTFVQLAIDIGNIEENVFKAQFLKTDDLGRPRNDVVFDVKTDFKNGDTIVKTVEHDDLKTQNGTWEDIANGAIGNSDGIFRLSDAFTDYTSVLLTVTEKPIDPSSPNADLQILDPFTIEFGITTGTEGTYVVSDKLEGNKGFKYNGEFYEFKDYTDPTNPKPFTVDGVDYFKNDKITAGIKRANTSDALASLIAVNKSDGLVFDFEITKQDLGTFKLMKGVGFDVKIDKVDANGEDPDVNIYSNEDATLWTDDYGNIKIDAIKVSSFDPENDHIRISLRESKPPKLGEHYYYDQLKNGDWFSFEAKGEVRGTKIILSEILADKYNNWPTFVDGDHSYAENPVIGENGTKVDLHIFDKCEAYFGLAIQKEVNRNRPGVKPTRYSENPFVIDRTEYPDAVNAKFKVKIDGTQIKDASGNEVWTVNDSGILEFDRSISEKFYLNNTSKKTITIEEVSAPDLDNDGLQDFAKINGEFSVEVGVKETAGHQYVLDTSDITTLPGWPSGAKVNAIDACVIAVNVPNEPSGVYELSMLKTGVGVGALENAKFHIVAKNVSINAAGEEVKTVVFDAPVVTDGSGDIYQASREPILLELPLGTKRIEVTYTETEAPEGFKKVNNGEPFTVKVSVDEDEFTIKPDKVLNEDEQPDGVEAQVMAMTAVLSSVDVEITDERLEGQFNLNLDKVNKNDNNIKVANAGFLIYIDGNPIPNTEQTEAEKNLIASKLPSWSEGDRANVFVTDVNGHIAKNGISITSDANKTIKYQEVIVPPGYKKIDDIEFVLEIEDTASGYKVKNNTKTESYYTMTATGGNSNTVAQEDAEEAGQYVIVMDKRDKDNTSKAVEGAGFTISVNGTLLTNSALSAADRAYISGKIPAGVSVDNVFLTNASGNITTSSILLTSTATQNIVIKEVIVPDNYAPINDTSFAAEVESFVDEGVTKYRLKNNNIGYVNDNAKISVSYSAVNAMIEEDKYGPYRIEIYKRDKIDQNKKVPGAGFIIRENNGYVENSLSAAERDSLWNSLTAAQKDLITDKGANKNHVFITDSNGEIKTRELAIEDGADRVVVVTEVVVPEGYAQLADQTFNLEVESKTIVINGVPTTLYRLKNEDVVRVGTDYNEKVVDHNTKIILFEQPIGKYDIVIHKFDEANHDTKVSGAGFIIKENNGFVVNDTFTAAEKDALWNALTPEQKNLITSKGANKDHIFVTDANGEIKTKDIEIRSDADRVVEITEVFPPVGYKALEDTFTVTYKVERSANGAFKLKDGNAVVSVDFEADITANADASDNAFVNIPEEEMSGKFKIVIDKVEKLTTHALPGAEFKIWVKAGDEAAAQSIKNPNPIAGKGDDIFVTDANGHIETGDIEIKSAASRTITLQETKAPVGYEPVNNGNAFSYTRDVKIVNYQYVLDDGKSYDTPFGVEVDAWNETVKPEEDKIILGDEPLTYELKINKVFKGDNSISRRAEFEVQDMINDAAGAHKTIFSVANTMTESKEIHFIPNASNTIKLRVKETSTYDEENEAWGKIPAFNVELRSTLNGSNYRIDRTFTPVITAADPAEQAELDAAIAGGLLKVSVSTDGRSIGLDIINALKGKVNLQFHKIDSISHLPMQNVKFTVKVAPYGYSSEETFITKTDTNGMLNILNIPVTSGSGEIKVTVTEAKYDDPGLTEDEKEAIRYYRELDPFTVTLHKKIEDYTYTVDRNNISVVPVISGMTWNVSGDPLTVNLVGELPNQRRIMRLSGQVWEDLPESGKVTTVSGTKNSSNEKFINDINVTIHATGSSTILTDYADLVGPTTIKTSGVDGSGNAKGEFYFDVPMYSGNYYIEYEYNGYKYQHTKYTPWIATGGVDSNATETEATRDAFNRNLQTINSGSVTTDINNTTVTDTSFGGMNIKISAFTGGFGSDNLAVYSASKHDMYEGKCDNRANSTNTENLVAASSSNTTIDGKLYDYVYNSIDLGITARESVRLQLLKSVNTVAFANTATGVTQYYTDSDYNSSWEPISGVVEKNGSDFTNTVATNNAKYEAAKDYQSEMTLAMRAEDIFTNTENAAENGIDKVLIGIKYRITLKNHSSEIGVRFDGLVDYYDKRLTLKSANLVNADGSVIAPVSYEDKGMDSSYLPLKSYNSDGDMTGAHTDEFNELRLSLNKQVTLNPGDTRYIDVVFNMEAIPENVISDRNNFAEQKAKIITNVAEVSSYTTYYANYAVNSNVCNPTNAQHTYVEHKKFSSSDYDGTFDPAGLVDLISNPHSVIGLQDRTYKPLEKPYQTLYHESDDGIAFVKFVEAEQRTITGNVWIDARDTEPTGSKAEIGNGSMGSGDIAYEGVKVQIYNAEDDTVAELHYYNPDTGLEEWKPSHVRTTNSEGRYEAFTGINPGRNYYILFTYPDGQTYKSTTFNNGSGLNISNPDSNTGVTFDLDHTDTYSHARDLQGSTSIKRTRAYVNDLLASSGEINNNPDDLHNIRSDYNAYITNYTSKFHPLADDIDGDEIAMDALTGILPVGFETNPANHGDNASVSYSDMGIIDGSTFELIRKYDITNLNLGVVERPKSQLRITKDIVNVKVILGDGSTPFDTTAGDRASGVIWSSATKFIPSYTDNKLEVIDNTLGLASLNGVECDYPLWRREAATSKGSVTITMDEEIMGGATIKIRYKIKVSNVGEVDYTNNEFYYYGKNPNADALVKTTVREIADYVGYQSDDSIHATRNNLKFFAVDNNTAESSGWVAKNAEDLNLEHKLSADAYNGAKTYRTVLVNELNKDLKPKWIASNTENTDNTIEKEVTLSATLGLDDLTYNNLTEIISLQNGVGRRTAFSTVGNQNPTYVGGPTEIDTDEAEEVRILPPYGQQHVYYVLYASVGAILFAGIAAIIIIRKKTSKE